MSHARCACPRGGRNDTTARGYSLRRFSRLGAGTFSAVAGASVLITAPTASRNASHELSFDTRLIAVAALAGPSRGARAAGRYAYWTWPQRPAAKLAPRGQARLWGTIATPTQRNATLRHATGTRWKVWERCYATRTQPNAKAGYAHRQRHSWEANAETIDWASSRLRELWATATGPGKGPNAAQRDWTIRWTAQRPPVNSFLTARSRCVPSEPQLTAQLCHPQGTYPLKNGNPGVFA
jgi:hypothetical protein